MTATISMPSRSTIRSLVADAQILVEEQDHQIDLATTLGVDGPNVSNAAK